MCKLKKRREPDAVVDRASQVPVMAEKLIRGAKRPVVVAFRKDDCQQEARPNWGEPISC